MQNTVTLSFSVFFNFFILAFFFVVDTFCLATFLAKVYSSLLPPFFLILKSLLFSLTPYFADLSHHQVCLCHFPCLEVPQVSLVALGELVLRCIHLSSDFSFVSLAWR